MRKLPLTAAALGVSLLLSAATDVSAATTTSSKTNTTKAQSVLHTLANLKSIKISAKSTVKLSDVNILTKDEESILTYTLTITNGDNKVLDLLDYWSKVKTSSGTTYSTTLMTSDKSKKTLSAGSSTTLTYVAKIGKNTKVSDLLFQVIKWDFNQPNYESLKGQFKIPATYLTSTPSSQSKTLKLFNTPVKARVEQVATFLSGDYNYVSVGLNLQNIGFNIFEDPKMKFVIKTSSGASYPMSVDPTSTDYKIQPQDTRTLNLITAIPKTIKLTNLELQIVQDDETSKLTLPIATMQLPNTTDKSLAIPINVEKYIALGSGKMSVKVTGATLLQGLDGHDLSVRVSLRNTTGATVTLPKYQFEVQTADGFRLPISTQATENLILAPLEEKVLNLSVSIPANVKAVGAQLFMNLPTSADSKESISYPAGIFAIPDVQPLQNMIGQTQFIQTSNGILGVTLGSIQRLPWSDGDLVSVKVKINNTSYKTIQLPELTGEMKIDSAKLKSGTNLISTQSVGLLGPNMSTDIYVVSKIPNYLDFSQLQVSLLEKLNETASSEWIQFGNSGNLSDLPKVTRGSVYTYSTSGRQVEAKVLRSYVYTGASSNLVYTEFEVKNIEDHQIDLSQFTGSYVGAGGQTYKASAKQVETSVGPDEKSIVALWAKIPKSISTTDMELIVGEGTTDNKFTPIKGESNGYVNAAALELGVTTPAVSNNLTKLDLFPYSLTVKNVRAYLNGSTSVSVNFDYDLSRDMDYSIGEVGHKYLFEIVDASGQTFEKEFTPETDLKIMNGGSASFSFDNTVFENRKSGSFTLNIYDQFEGYKTKIGSQSLYYLASSK
ncbi:MAG: hypothetical protein E6Y08_18215 [Paenibacillus sp.]|nr:hypothetical protein [Paenibacillus sp.]MDU4697744.1 hypothetical protein [Paenibacillus sp.]